MDKSLFNESKAAESVAFLLAKAGGSIEVLKLMKLVYLAERESYETWGEPLFGDEPFSFEHGPVLSKAFDLAKAKSTTVSAPWKALIAPSIDKHVRLADPASFDAATLMAVSESDIDLLEKIWQKFGHLTASQLRAYTHKHLPEYEEPEPGTRTRINPAELLKAVGFTEEEAARQVAGIQAASRAKRAMTAAA